MDKLNLDQDNEVFKQYKIDKGNVLNNLSKINIFVGANNSGKSRFLREIFKEFTNALHFGDKKTILNYFKIPFSLPTKQLIDGANENTEVSRNKRVFESVLKSFKNREEHANWQDFETKLNKSVGIHGKQLKEKDSVSTNQSDTFNSFRNALSEYIFQEHRKKIIANYHTTYIPILRSLRQTKNSQTAYQDRAIDDYFKDIDGVDNVKNSSKKIDVFTGESLYREIKELQDSGYKGSQIKEPYEKLISDYFFNGKTVFIYANKKENINNDYGKVVSIKIGNKKEFPIYELGDGIQTILLYTFPLFKHKDKKHFLFIEEPEQNLHPGMQRILLEILNDKMFKNAKVFFTTHSNHLLDTTIESSKQTTIFSFQEDKLEDKNGNMQIPTFTIENLKSSTTDILNDLGVRNSSVFLANCTIWVEGVTDRKYIKQFMKMYFYKNNINNYYEDLHYSFVEYAGSNIAHWDFEKEDDSENIFVGSISNRVFLIADSDIAKNGKKNIRIDNERYFKIGEDTFEIKKWRRHKKLKKNLDENFYRLDSKEIENLLTPDVIKGTVGEYQGEDICKLKFKNDLKDITFEGINKKVVERPTYWWQNIGEFIDENLNGINCKTYQKDNSIKDKPNFCNKAIIYMENQKENWKNDYDKLLSKEAQELCEKIHNFIKSHNEDLS